MSGQLETPAVADTESAQTLAVEPRPLSEPPDTRELIDLVRRSQAGDRPAFEQIVRLTARLLYSRLYLQTGNVHKAEDLLQQTFLLAWRRRDQLTEPAGLRAWLLTVADSVLLDDSRRQTRRKRGGGRGSDAGESEMDNVSDPAPSPPESAERSENLQRVLAELRSLPEEYRMPITLRYLGGADYETIGRQLGLTNGSLRGLLHRGMARLREKLKDL